MEPRTASKWLPQRLCFRGLSRKLSKHKKKTRTRAKTKQKKAKKKERAVCNTKMEFVLSPNRVRVTKLLVRCRNIFNLGRALQLQLLYPEKLYLVSHSLNCIRSSGCGFDMNSRSEMLPQGRRMCETLIAVLTSVRLFSSMDPFVRFAL